MNRTPVQNLLFKYHSQSDEGAIIYYERDLVKVMDELEKELVAKKGVNIKGENNLARSYMDGQLDLVNEMRDFFMHKA